MRIYATLALCLVTFAKQITETVEFLFFQDFKSATQFAKHIRPSRSLLQYSFNSVLAYLHGTCNLSM